MSRRALFAVERAAIRAAAVLACAGMGAAGCGSKRSPPKARDDAGVAGHDARRAPALEQLPLGLASADAFGWQARGGHEAYQVAHAAAAAGRWADVVIGCEAALAQDRGHLEAAWLLAEAYGQLGQLEKISDPLQRAVAGDVGRWGEAALAHPALGGFLATAAGDLWRVRLAQLRTDYLAAIARGTLVVAGPAWFAIDPSTSRWIRLTTAIGVPVGALRATRDHLAYVTRTIATGAPSTMALGTVDLSTGREVAPIAVGSPGPMTLAYSAKPPVGFWIRTTTPRPRWRRVDGAALAPLPVKTKLPRGARLEVGVDGVALIAAAAPTITADWDDRGQASAIRIGSSNRVVSAPTPGLIDGATLTWSPGRSHVAFIAHLDDGCVAGVPSSFAYVADAATGRVVELDRGVLGLAIEWMTERRVVIAGDRGVAMVEIHGGEPDPIVGADGLVVPRRRARCAAIAAPAQQPDGSVVEPPPGVSSSPPHNP